MRLVCAAVLYTALATFANADPALEAMREGDMRKLVFHAESEPVPDVTFLDEAEQEMRLQDLGGKYLLVNFWATWCAPCREEMPYLDELQVEFGGERFEVVTIATGRNPPAAIRRFFEEYDVKNLPMYRDPTQALARHMAVLGLPITVIIDPEGREIARLRGDAHWSSDNAKAIISTMIAGDS